MRFLSSTNPVKGALARLRRIDPVDARTFISFFLFGLINNVLYVIILSAALDLVGIDIPKGVVLLADVVPSFFVKLVAPYFVEKIPYATRVILFACLSAAGMLIIALTPTDQDNGTIAIKLLGVAFASLASGGGELSFLALTHFYGQSSLAAWSSGTGGAGLVGAWLYVLCTSTFGFSSGGTLLACSFFPVIMLGSYFALLPPHQDRKHGYQTIEDGDEDGDDQDMPQSLQQPQTATAYSEESTKSTSLIKRNLLKAKALIIPYMLPLFLVYVAEYTINQGVASTLLFPLASTPFKAFREFYPTYNALYQVGVFISRSSITSFRIHSLYTPSILQIINLVSLTMHSLFDFLPSVWLVFVIVFWEGLLGGAVYVNTFAEISDNVPEEDREFSLAATTVSDSGGIVVAALLGMVFEKGLCSYQVAHGRPYCRQT